MAKQKLFRVWVETTDAMFGYDHLVAVRSGIGEEEAMLSYVDAVKLSLESQGHAVMNVSVLGLTEWLEVN